MSVMKLQLTKIPSLRSVADFRTLVDSLGVHLPLDDKLVVGLDSPLLQAATWESILVSNRIAIQPMEGWDASLSGEPSPATMRRWGRFGESGAQLIWGGEAMAVRPDGRANPNQLVLSDANVDAIATLPAYLRYQHRSLYGADNQPTIGFQLTHSGRFCRPNQQGRWEPKVAYRHPLLDQRFGVTHDGQLWTDLELAQLIDDYVHAAKNAQRAGAQFVDVKCCHGYLLHEFLGAHTRSGSYGGSFENRTRLLLEIIHAIRNQVPGLGIGVRLSAFDSVPFRANDALAEVGKKGPGEPVPHAHLIPYRWGFGIDPFDPTQLDLTEPFALVHLLSINGVRMINLSAGSPYYTPHLLRPAAYPPSDGYQPHQDPLIGVAKHLEVARSMKLRFPDVLFVGSGYSYLQEFLPLVAQHQVAQGFIDFVGLGRAVLAYPSQLLDAIMGREVQRKRICRTFSDCTTAPRNGLPSGCYPLDDYYKKTADAVTLKQIKAGP